jgi:hypothetical protein
MKLSKQDAHKIQGHLHLIFAILAKYESEWEPFDQVDAISAKVHEIEQELNA